jgi:uncharacterized protein YjbJ (UPF0337 family)
VFLLIAGLVFFVFQNLDEIVRRGTEEAMTYALQVDVTVDGASVDLGAGTIELTGVNIPNPEGYTSDHAMAFSRIRVEADTSTLRSDTPTLNLVQVTGSDIILEREGTTSNLQQLMANAQRLSSGEEPPPDEPEGKKMVIRRLVVDGTTVGVQLPVLNQNLSVQVPDIEAEDIGGEGEEVTPAEALQEFIALILEAITRAGDGILPAEFLQDINGQLSNLSGELQDRLGDLGSQFEGALEGVRGSVEGAPDQVNEAADDARENVEGAVRDIEEGLGGLLGRRNSEDQ